MQEAADVLQRQTMEIGVGDIIPESKQLFAFATVVEKYARKVRKQRQTNATFTAHSRQQPSQADSYLPTDSTVSDSFVSTLSPRSVPVAITSPATSTEELDTSSYLCRKCPGVCHCSKIESHPVTSIQPSSPNNALPLYPAGFEHPSHRFDRSWQQPERKDTAYETTKSTGPTSDENPYKSGQTLKEIVKPDQEIERTMREPEESLAVVEADRLQNMESNSVQSSSDEEYESDGAVELDEALDNEAQQSPFQPVAGVLGRFPRNWRNRHGKSESPDDHWHRRL
jgi:hypothetical protein